MHFLFLLYYTREYNIHISTLRNFTQNEAQPAIINLKASNYSHDFKIQHEGLIIKIATTLCMDYSSTEKNPNPKFMQ